MEAYLALFEPDRKAGGYVVTFPDFGYVRIPRDADQRSELMPITIPK
jgi:hypothetical protein